MLDSLSDLLPDTIPRTGKRISTDLRISGKGMRSDSLRVTGRIKAVRDENAKPVSEVDPKTRPAGLPEPVRRLISLLKPFHEMEARLEAPTPGLIEIRSRMNAEGLTVDLTGTSTTAGELDLAVGAVSDDFEQLKKSWGIDPDPEKPRLLDFSGPLSFHGSLKGPIITPYLQGSLSADRTLLRETPIGALSLDMAFERKRVLVREAVITQGAARYLFSGRIDLSKPARPRFDLKVRSIEGRPEQFLMPFFDRLALDAVVNGEATVEGSKGELSVKAHLELAEIMLYGIAFERGEIVLEVTESEIFLSRVHLRKAGSVLSGDGRIGYKDRTFNARMESEDLYLQDLQAFREKVPQVRAHLATSITGSGQFGSPEFRGQVTVRDLVVAEQSLGKGELHMTMLGKNLAFEGNLEQTQINGLMRLETGIPLKATVAFRDLPLDPFLQAQNIKALEKVTLLTSGDMSVSGKLLDPIGLHIEGSISHLSADIAGYTVTNQGEGILEFDDGFLRVKSFHLRGEGTSVSLSGEAHLQESLNLFVNGEADLDVFRLLTDEISYGKGKAYLVLKITERWNDPSIHGGLTVQDGTIRFETLGQTLQIATMGVFFNQRQVLLETLDAETHGGRLTATGKLELKNLAPSRFGMILDLAGVRAALGTDSSAIFSGNFLFQGDPESQTIRGEAFIERASYIDRVDVKSLVFRLQKREEIAAPPTPLIGDAKLDIHVSGKNNIRINNNVAKLPLELDLFIKGTVDHPLIFGHVESRTGDIYFQRHVFKVESGTLDFINPERITPVVDLRANTRVRNYDVRMNLSGRLDKGFDLGLTSDPPLTETDILALLTVGKTTDELQEISGDQATGYGLQRCCCSVTLSTTRSRN